MAMTPDQFLLEYWKVYEAYMGRKERLIEVTTTLYLASTSTLLLQSGDFWFKHVGAVAALWLAASLLVGGFIRSQFGHWADAARICNSCQTLMAQWFATTPPSSALVAVDEPSLPDIQVPQGLKDEMDRRRARWRNLRFCEKVCSSPFGVTVYGLTLVWMVAFWVRVYTAWMAHFVVR